MLALPQGAAATGPTDHCRLPIADWTIEETCRAEIGNRDVWPRRSVPCPDRRRRAGCKMFCANSNGKHPRRNRPGGKDRLAHSCSRRPCKPGRRARGRSRKSRGWSARKRRAWTDKSPSTRRDRARAASALARRSARSMSPSLRQATGTTLNPAMTALAGLVPCAEVGIRQTLRCASPRDA